MLQLSLNLQSIAALSLVLLEKSHYLIFSGGTFSRHLLFDGGMVSSALAFHLATYIKFLALLEHSEPEKHSITDLTENFIHCKQVQLKQKFHFSSQT